MRRSMRIARRMTTQTRSPRDSYPTRACAPKAKRPSSTDAAWGKQHEGRGHRLHPDGDSGGLAHCVGDPSDALMPNQHWTRYQNWSVFWYSAKRGKYVRKRFGEDIGAAIKFFGENQQRKGITLHPDNHGYPPPKRITEHERTTWSVVTRKGKKYKKKVVTVVNLMNEYNRKGIWWCSYCVKLRRFELIQTEHGPEMYCPVCKVSHRLVKQHNPQASAIEMHKAQRRTTNGKRRRRRA